MKFTIWKLNHWKLFGNFSVWNLEIAVFSTLLILCSLWLPKTANAGLLINRTLYLGLTSGLVGHWTFDGKDMGGAGTTAADVSGQNNHGTLTNGPVRAIGKLGQGSGFWGVDRKYGY